MSEVVKPIIIVGTGRCGSTMLYKILARHHELGWLSTFNEVFPRQTWLSKFSNLYRAKAFSRVNEAFFFPKPFEAYKFWDRYAPGFSRRERPPDDGDVPDSAVEPIRSAVGRILKNQRKPRLLVKVTGWSRIGFFNKIFPDARFVFLNREVRSVLSSWVQAGWLDVTSEIKSPEWQWGEVPETYARIWEELGGGPLLSAAMKIRLDLDDIAANRSLLPGRCLEVQYENVIQQPVEELKAILDYAELEWNGNFEAEINAKTFYNPIDKWKKYLSEEEGEAILEFFRRTTETT